MGDGVGNRNGAGIVSENGTGTGEWTGHRNGTGSATGAGTGAEAGAWAQTALMQQKS